MKKRHIAVNIVTGFFAALLCILLTLMLFATTLYSSVTAMLTPQNIGALAQTAIDEVVEQLDPESMMQENTQLQQTIEDMGVPAEAVTHLLQSKTVEQIMDLYAQDVAGVLVGEEITGSVTPEALKEIVNNNMDEIIGIVTEVSGEEIDPEEIRSQLNAFMDQEADKLTEALPPVETLVEPLMESDAAEALEMATNPAILWAAILVCLVLAGIVYALRCYRFGGFMWMGVCAAVAALLLVAANAAIHSPLLMELLADSAAEAQPLVNAVLSVYSGSLLTRILLLGGVAVVFIAGYILLYYLVVNKKKMAAAAAEAETLPAEAPAEAALPETAE